MTIWRNRIACWIPKGTNIHSEYVTLIAFPRQQWLRERASMLRYTYVICLVECKVTTWRPCEKFLLVSVLWRQSANGVRHVKFDMKTDCASM
jgi:hypothetical protein